MTKVDVLIILALKRLRLDGGYILCLPSLQISQGALGSQSFCSVDKPCDLGEGHCENDGECAPSLLCKENKFLDTHFSLATNLCVLPPSDELNPLEMFEWNLYSYYDDYDYENFDEEMYYDLAGLIDFYNDISGSDDEFTLENMAASQIGAIDRIVDEYDRLYSDLLGSDSEEGDFWKVDSSDFLQLYDDSFDYYLDKDVYSGWEYEDEWQAYSMQQFLLGYNGCDCAW